MSIKLEDLTRALDSYNIIRKIGEGGSRETFLAYKENTHIPVVLKIFKTKNTHERISSQRKRHSLTDILSRELELIRYLSHPNIVRYYTHGKVLDTFYLEEEYMAGGSVLANIHNLNEKKGITLFMQLLSGVQFCHERDFILRDIKMDNTLLNEDHSIIKIDDLELAGNAREILETRSIGSKKYSAPELEQQNSVPNYQTDIFSLGCWLYYILTKEKETIQTINHLHIDEYNRALNRVLSKTPEIYRETLIGCLSFEPEKRFRSITEVQNSLFDLNPIVMTVFQKENIQLPIKTYHENSYTGEKIKDAEENDFSNIGELCSNSFRTHNIFTKPRGIVTNYIIDSHYMYQKKGGGYIVYKKDKIITGTTLLRMDDFDEKGKHMRVTLAHICTNKGFDDSETLYPLLDAAERKIKLYIHKTQIKTVKIRVSLAELEDPLSSILEEKGYEKEGYLKNHYRYGENLTLYGKIIKK